MSHHYEKCRFGIAVEDNIVCANHATDFHLEIVSEDINICVGCKSYFSHICEDNFNNSDEDTGELSYED